jgi:hypothetical protein
VPTPLIVDPTPTELAHIAARALDPTANRRPAPSDLLALWLYLPVDVPTPSGNVRIQSTLAALLGECRSVTNRDAVGEVLPRAHAGSWLGAIGYLSLLDQVGSAVRHRHPPSTPAGATTVEQALADFGSCSGADATTLYALRCSLAHDYSLVNIGEARAAARRRTLHHVFTLTQGAPQLVQRPVHAWGGTRPNTGGTTVVDVRRLGDLVEEVIRQVRVAYETRELELNLNGGAKSPAMWRRCRFFQHHV